MWILAILLAGSGCSRPNLVKQAQRSWAKFTPKTMRAKVEWSDGQKQLPGSLLFQKPFLLHVAIHGVSDYIQRPEYVTLVKHAWISGVEVRKVPPIEEEGLVRMIGQSLDSAARNYEVESVEGPVIAGRRTSQVTLRPKARGTAGAGGIEEVERYWFDAEISVPLRYALLGPDDAERYSWSVTELELDVSLTFTNFFYFPPGDWYNLPLYLPTPAVFQNAPSAVLAMSFAEIRQKLDYPLFDLGVPAKLQQATMYSNRPLLDYSDKKRAGFTYLLQAPLVDPADAQIELAQAKDSNWKAVRSKRFEKGQDFGPGNPGMASLKTGERTVGYDNYYGVKVFGWTENGQALTVITTGDLRETLAAIAAGQFR